jgi:hypothetical protein
MSRLERDLPDTGSLRGDLTAWAASAAADLARPEGRLFLLALITSIPSTPQAQAERDQHLQRRMRALRQVTDRAAARGESPPDPGTIADAVLGRSTGARYGAPSPPIPPMQAHWSTAFSARPATTAPTPNSFRMPHTGRTASGHGEASRGRRAAAQPASRPPGSARPPASHDGHPARHGAGGRLPARDAGRAHSDDPKPVNRSMTPLAGIPVTRLSAQVIPSGQCCL